MKVRSMAMVVALLALVGCGGSEKQSPATPSAQPAAKKYKVAVIPKAESHIFWKTCRAGAMKAEQETGAEVIWKGPDKEDDRNAQVQTVQNFTVKRVDAVALAPIDSDVLVKPVEAAARAGIKVVIFDSGLTKDDAIESFVATDNYQGGVLCARAMAKATGGQGKILVLRMMEGSQSTTLRENGFIDTVKKESPGLELVSTDQYGGSSIGSAQKKAQLLMSKYAKEIDCVFTPNETTTEAMLLTLKQTGMAGKITFVGFDANQAIIAAINDGILNAVAVQNPFNMGYLAVVTAVKALKGEAVDKRVDTGCTIVDAANIATPEIQELINPDVGKWLDK